METILVTGGAGFIGSNFIRHLLATSYSWKGRIVNLDNLTYAGNLDNLRDVEGDPRYRFVKGDVRDRATVRKVMREVDVVVHFAAETHVDRSLLEGGQFISTDVLGTYVLLDAARQQGVRRFLHVSTDEVYGESLPGQRFQETDPFHPRSPYSASKAGGEMQCMAFFETHGLPVVIARPANNVGPYQHVEKAVPLFVTNALNDEPLPLYGEGLQVRDRLYVADDCEALALLLRAGEPGQAYNIGADNERTNLEVAQTLLDLLDKPRSLIRLVEDRPGHDRQYSLDSSKIRALGWSPKHGFQAAMEMTVEWYVNNRWWWEKVRSGRFRRYYQRQYGRRLAAARSPSARGAGG